MDEESSEVATNSEDDKQEEGESEGTVGNSKGAEVESIKREMTIFIILRQNDHFETFALLFHQLF